MPYRQNAESLQQILEDAIEMAMAPAGENRRADVARMLERIDRAVALAEIGAEGTEGKDDEVLQSLKQVRGVLDALATAGRHTSFEVRQAVNKADEAEARASARGVQLRILEVTLKESAVVTAQIDVVRFAAQREALSERKRGQLAASVALLRERFESGTNLLRLATLEPCTELHAQLLERKVDRLEDDLKRVYDAWQRGNRRLSRA
jgi:hypothetical protein